MGFMRHQSGTSITVDRQLDEVFQAVIQAGKSVGKIKEESKIAGYVVVRTGMKLFAPENASTVRISLKKIGDSQTEMSLSSDSFDGAIGFGSAGKAIDKIIKALEQVLQVK